MTRARISKLKILIVPMICFAIMGYFGKHVVMGLDALGGLRIKIGSLHEELGEIKAQRLLHQHRVGLLRPGSLDPDMLEERARASLNAARIDDIVIFRRPSNP